MADEIETKETEVEKIEDTKEEVKDTKQKVEASEDVEEEEKDSITSEERNLLALLKDAKTAPMIIKALAEQAGFEIAAKDVKNKESRSKLADKLTAKLGKDWGQFAEQIGEVLEEELSTLKQSFKDEFSQTEEKSRRTNFQKAEKKFFDDNPEAKAYKKKMASLASRYSPPDEMDPEEYFGDLFTLASGRKSSITDTVEQKRRDRIKKNEDTDNITGTSRSDKKGNKNLSLKESIAGAIKSLSGDKD